MQLPYSWIKELVDIDWPPEELAQRLTLSGSEAEVIQPFSGKFENIVVGQIVEIEPIEGTDHLKRAVVDTGGGKHQVVCGAPNVAVNQKVIFAGVGSKLEGGFIIKKAKLKGVESDGMICSERELGLSDDHSGIMILADDAPIGEPAGKCLGLDDHVIEFDLTPNRMDMLCAIGVARDLACLAGKKVRRPKYKLKEIAEKAGDLVEIAIDDADACPRYSARLIKNVKIGQSPWWIKQKLIMCGIRPISNVVDITNLVMMEYGHPLHAFDYDKIESRKILVRRAQAGELFTTLDGEKHELTPEVLLITDGVKGIAAGGIMGGLDSEVTENTSNILLEAAYFNAATIRRGRLELGINSESSYRFERGMDPNIIPAALDRAAYLMHKYAGGEIFAGIVDCYPRKIAPREIKFRPDRANAFLGTNISRQRMIKILKSIEMDVKDEGILEVSVPTWQPEITREVDLIEEIARLEGYDSIETNDRNSGPLFSPEYEDDLFRKEIRSVMTAQGFDEIYSIGLADSRLLTKLNNNFPQLKILNPIAEDLDVMQNDINYSLLKSVSHNIAHRNINIMLFALDKAFFPDSPASEKEKIGMAISGGLENRWYIKGIGFDFYHLKGAVDSLIEHCRLPQVEYLEKDFPVYEDGYSFELNTHGTAIGQAGRIRTEIAKQFDIKQMVLTCVLDFDILLDLKLPVEKFKPLPRFPAAPRDLAIVVDESIKVGDIKAEIFKAGGSLLKEIDIFDVYRGKPIAAGKKSIAFSMVYRSDKKSLLNEEVIAIQEKIANHLRNRFNAEIREG